MEIEYYKCIVIELDPFCESRVVFEQNFSLSEHDGMVKQLDSKYFDNDLFLIIFAKQKLYLEK